MLNLNQEMINNKSNLIKQISKVSGMILCLELKTKKSSRFWHYKVNLPRKNFSLWWCSSKNHSCEIAASIPCYHSTKWYNRSLKPTDSRILSTRYILQTNRRKSWAGVKVRSELSLVLEICKITKEYYPREKNEINNLANFRWGIDIFCLCAGQCHELIFFLKKITGFWFLPLRGVICSKVDTIHAYFLWERGLLALSIRYLGWLLTWTIKLLAEEG